MRYFPTRPRRVRLLLVCLGVATGVLAAAAIALAAFPQDSVTVLTGCLSTGGTGGNISNVAVGSSPTKSCGPTSVLIHLSGGTITQVSAGPGLNGGGSNGYVTLGVDPKYQLPQNGCSSGQFVASDGAGGWSCQSQKTYGGSDFALSNQSCDSGQFLTGIDSSGRKLCGADQTYTNGTGIDLNGNSFRLISSYRLPQGCNSGDVATSDGNGGWTCQSPISVGGSYTYTETRSASIGDNDTRTAVAGCNPGDFLTGGGGDVDGNAGLDATGPGSGGWYARGTVPFDFGFGSGDVYAFARCLHLG
jgi:hypothetical protein